MVPARKFGGPHGYGYLRDPHWIEVASSQVLVGGTGPLAKSASVEAFVPRIFDQSITSSCVGQASAGAIATDLAAKGTPIAMPSRLGIYTVARCASRAPLLNGSLPPLQDIGSMPYYAMTGLAEWGVAPEAKWPFDPASVNDEPDLARLESASEFKLVEPYRIDSIGSQRLTDIKRALMAKHPVTLAVPVDDAFENYVGTEPLRRPRGRIKGAHYVYLCGFDTTWNGRMAVRFPNSWDTSWGDAGFGTGDEDFLIGAADLYVFDVRRKAPSAFPGAA